MLRQLVTWQLFDGMFYVKSADYLLYKHLIASVFVIILDLFLNCTVIHEQTAFCDRSALQLFRRACPLVVQCSCSVQKCSFCVRNADFFVFKNRIFNIFSTFACFAKKRYTLNHMKEEKSLLYFLQKRGNPPLSEKGRGESRGNDTGTFAPESDEVPSASGQSSEAFSL